MNHPKQESNQSTYIGNLNEDAFAGIIPHIMKKLFLNFE